MSPAALDHRWSLVVVGLRAGDVGATLFEEVHSLGGRAIEAEQWARVRAEREPRLAQRRLGQAGQRGNLLHGRLHVQVRRQPVVRSGGRDDAYLLTAPETLPGRYVRVELRHPQQDGAELEGRLARVHSEHASLPGRGHGRARRREDVDAEVHRRRLVGPVGDGVYEPRLAPAADSSGAGGGADAGAPSAGLGVLDSQVEQNRPPESSKQRGTCARKPLERVLATPGGV
jgi:hypothetical protein